MYMYDVLCAGISLATMTEVIGLKKFMQLVRTSGSFPAGYHRCRIADLKLTPAQKRSKKKEKPTAALPSYYQPASQQAIAAAQAAAAAAVSVGLTMGSVIPVTAPAVSSSGSSSSSTLSRVRSHDQMGGTSASAPTAKRQREAKQGRQ